jgi:hypothetical protein
MRAFLDTGAVWQRALEKADAAPRLPGVNVVGDAGPQPLVRSLAAVPERVPSELSLQGSDRPKQQEIPREFVLQRPPEAVDPRQVRLAQGGEAPADPRSETSYLGLPWRRIASFRRRQASEAPGSEGHARIARTFLDASRRSTQAAWRRRRRCSRGRTEV